MKHSKSKITEALGIDEQQFLSCMEVAKVASMGDKLSKQIAGVMDSFGLDKKNPNLIMVILSAYMLGQVQIATHISKAVIEIEKINPHEEAPHVTN